MTRAAALHHARRRRLSQAGRPELFRTHDYAIPTAAIATGTQFPKRDHPIHFRTAVRITGAAPAGLIFELGSNAVGCAAWIDGKTIQFRAGEALAASRGLAVYTHPTAGLAIPIGWSAVVEFAVRPHDGAVRIFVDGLEAARDTASSGSMTEWADSGAGSFASIVNGTTPADVTQTGAPFGFDVVERLSVYDKQVPRHFLAASSSGIASVPPPCP